MAKLVFEQQQQQKEKDHTMKNAVSLKMKSDNNKKKSYEKQA